MVVLDTNNEYFSNTMSKAVDNKFRSSKQVFDKHTMLPKRPSFFLSRIKHILQTLILIGAILI